MSRILRILVLAALAFAGLWAFRARVPARAGAPVPSSPAATSVRPPAPQDAVPPAAEANAQVPPAPEVEKPTEPPPSPACAELLARIQGLPEKELEAVADGLVAAEAETLYGKLSASDRRQVFSALPRPLLARKAKELLGVPEVFLLKARFPGILAWGLADIASGAWKGTPKKHTVALRFAAAVDPMNAPVDARDRFRPGERRIYACLDAGPEPKGIPGVLVRWDEEGYGSDTLVYLHYQTLNLNRRWNYVYFDRQEPWPPGTYHVRFFQIGEPMLLLAEGTYVVGSGD